MTAQDYFYAGLAHARRGETAEAFENIEKAVELDPDHAGACKELARLSLQVNEIRAFVNWCHEASRIDPGDPEPYEMMAALLRSQKRDAEADEALRAAAGRRALS